MDISYPASYRQEFLSKITRLLLRGESVLLFGPPGTGKTSDIQYLFLSEEAKKLYFRQSEVAHLWLNADEIFEENQKLYIDQLTSLRETNPNHLVIILDHADHLIDSGLSTLFPAIRSLRESTRPWTCLLALSDQNLTATHNLGALTPIRPLLLENLLIVPALSDSDANSQLDIWSSYYEIKLKIPDREEIIRNSGGIPRLIKRLVKLAADDLSLISIIRDPASDQKLELDLEKISSFNNANPEFQYKIPLLDNLEKISAADFDQVGKIQFTTRLSRQEYALANFLIAKAGNFVSREEMVTAIWPKNLYETSEHALDQMIHRLRQKMQTTTPKCTLTTYRGRGVRLEFN